MSAGRDGRPNGESEERARPRATMADAAGEVAPSRSSSLRRLGESVADTEDGEDESGRSRIGLDLLPHVLDVGVNRPLIRLEGDAADSVQELSACEHPARLARHRRHELELGPG